MSGETDTASRTSPPPSVAEYRVGSLAAIRSGELKRANIAGKRIALFSVGDEVAATAGRCPHASGPLHEGEVAGTVLTCPWHGWSFDLRSGACEEDPDLFLERYPVRIDGDDVLVTL